MPQQKMYNLVVSFSGNSTYIQVVHEYDVIKETAKTYALRPINNISGKTVVLKKQVGIIHNHTTKYSRACLVDSLYNSDQLIQKMRDQIQTVLQNEATEANNKYQSFLKETAVWDLAHRPEQSNDKN